MKIYDGITQDTTMRPGWTMIELIFIIVIIGILAAIASSRLAATREDAKLSMDVTNMSMCIREMGASYTATGADINDSYSSSIACGKVKCYTMDINKTSMIVQTDTTTSYCADIDNVGGHMATTYQFAGAGISK